MAALQEAIPIPARDIIPRTGLKDALSTEGSQWGAETAPAIYRLLRALRTTGIVDCTLRLPCNCYRVAKSMLIFESTREIQKH